jgi:hypothetical protein
VGGGVGAVIAEGGRDLWILRIEDCGDTEWS